MILSVAMDTDNVSKEALEELSRVLSLCDNQELIRDFLQSILTPAEADDVAKRWALVRMLDEGETQRSIAAQLHMSLCKITRGSRELKREHSPFRAMIDLSDEASRE